MARKKHSETIKTFPGAMDQDAAVEKVDGDILPQSIDTSDKLPEDIRDRIEGAIYDFMMYECKPPIDDMSKARQTRWTACCMYIGQRVNKPLLRTAERGEGGKWKGYDIGVMEALLPIWLYYCSTFDKAPMRADFGHFCGASLEWVYDQKPELLTPERMGLTKKLIEIQEAGLSGLIADGSRNPTGAIAILNHHHGWTNTSVVVHTSDKQAISAVELPKLGGDS